LALTLSVNFGIINPYLIIWSWHDVTKSLELWRFLTTFCYAGPFSFNTLVACYMLVQFSKQYESGGPFNTGAGGGTADYAFMMLLGMATMLLTYPLVLGLFPIPPVFCHNLIYYVLYVWSKRHSTSQASIWGFPVLAVYLPFVYLALTVFTGGDYFGMLHGLAMGHLYYFLVDVIPVVYGKDVLQTPRFLLDFFGVGHYQAPAFNPPPVAARREGGGFYGAGRQLGTGDGGAGGGGAAAAQRRGGDGHNWGGGGNRLGTN
jgi:Derlin-2/3